MACPGARYQQKEEVGEWGPREKVVRATCSQGPRPEEGQGRDGRNLCEQRPGIHGQMSFLGDGKGSMHRSRSLQKTEGECAKSGLDLKSPKFIIITYFSVYKILSHSATHFIFATLKQGGPWRHHSRHFMALGKEFSGLFKVTRSRSHNEIQMGAQGIGALATLSLSIAGGWDLCLWGLYLV